jgi:hypothetical protein
MKQRDYRGYTVKAASRQDPPGEWRGQWIAVKMDGSQAISKFGVLVESVHPSAAMLRAASSHGHLV